MQDLTALEGKTIVELREIAKVLGIVPSTMKKQELLDRIIAVATGASTSSESTESNSIDEAHEESQPRRGRRPRMSSVKVGGGPTPRVEVAVAEPMETVAEERTAEVEPSNEQSAEVVEVTVPKETTNEAPVQRRRGRKPRWLIEQERLAEEQAKEQEAAEGSAEPEILPEPEPVEVVTEGATESSTAIDEEFDEETFDEIGRAHV